MIYDILFYQIYNSYFGTRNATKFGAYWHIFNKIKRDDLFGHKANWATTIN